VIPTGILRETMLPNGLLLCFILAALLLTGISSRRERSLLLREISQLRVVGSLVRELNNSLFDERRNLLSFRFRQDPGFLTRLNYDLTRQAELTQQLHARAISSRSRSILADFELLRAEMPAMRARLLRAIRGRSEKESRLAFARWNLVAQQSEALTVDLGGHMVARLERVQQSLETQEARLHFTILVLALAVLFWIVGSAIHNYRVLVRPLVQMTEVARGISRGNLELRVPPSPRPGELAALGEAFNKTASDLIRANAALRESLTELRRSNRELEQFAYVASHDLKEPLRMINTYVQLLRREMGDTLTERNLQCIDFATGGAMRMNELIDGLLEYSRIAQERVPDLPVPCHLVVRDALDNLESTLRDSGTRVCIDALPVVRGNRLQLTRLFQNLISNAVKFRGAAPARVQVDCLASGEQWVFRVIDNGIGIDPRYSEKIFVIFQRLHNRGDYPGTGIGLSICKKIVEQHGGQIWVESAVGAGARFCFSLPRSPSPPVI
jgi:signal transduction histidine kinase